MKACVIGGGPAGIFISKYLTNYGILVDLYEKDSKLLGNFNFAIENKIDSTTKKSLINSIEKNKLVKIYLNTEISDIKKMQEYDFYVAATGGSQRKLEIKGGNKAVDAMDIIKRITQLNENKIAVDRNFLDSNEEINKIVIIGFGNVTMDLLNHLYGNIKETVVLCRSGIKEASFSNHVLRELIDSNKYSISILGNNSVLSEFNRYSTSMIENNTSLVTERKNLKRFEILNKINFFYILKENLIRKIRESLGFPVKPKLKLIFDAKPLEIENKTINFFRNNKIYKESFDLAINSTGFIPNKIALETEKPVYYVGWSNEAKGDLGTSMNEAKRVAEEIIKTLS